MNTHQFRKLQEQAASGKYKRLFMTLLVRVSDEWQTTIGEVEMLLKVNLPESARLYSAWWDNDDSHSHTLAWMAAGWETTDVDIDAETLVFTRKARVDRSLFDLNVVFPVHHAKLLVKDATFSREEIYEDRI
jgi:hypothetical protein